MMSELEMKHEPATPTAPRPGSVVIIPKEQPADDKPYKTMEELNGCDRCKLNCAIRALCRWCGRSGLSSLEPHKPLTLKIAIGLQLLCFIFLCVAICGVSTNATTIKNTSWVHGSGIDAATGNSYDYYMNFAALLIKTAGGEHVIELGDLNDDTGFDKCKDSAENGMKGLYFTMVVTLVISATWPLQTMARLYADHGFNKCNAIFGAVMQILSLIGAVSAYGQKCISDLDEYGTTGFTIQPGAGYVLCILACVVQIVACLVQFLVRAPIPPQFGTVVEDSCCTIVFASADASASTSDISAAKPAADGALASTDSVGQQQFAEQM